MIHYIFLDMDGVLNHAQCEDFVHLPEDHRITYHFRDALKRASDGSCILQGFLGCDEECVRALNKLCSTLVDVRVVLSSIWRHTLGLRDTERQLRRQGYTGPSLWGETPTLHGRERGDEIQAYMDEHGIQAEQIVILDDDSDMHHLLPRLVRTSFKDGLRQEHVEQALSLFAKC